MLTEQTIYAESSSTGTDHDVPFGFVISEDGRMLLTMMERDDGAVDLVTVPVALMPQNNSTMVQNSVKVSNENVILNSPVFQISLEDIPSVGVQQPNLFHAESYRTIPTVAIEIDGSNAIKEVDTEATNASLAVASVPSTERTDLSKREDESESGKSSPARKNITKRSPGRPRKDGTTPPSNVTNYLKCDICGQSFNRQMLYRRHMENHAEEKPHRCPKCPASFNVPTNFTLHMAIHNTGEPKCPECGRKFARMASLKSHMLLHEKEENLFCTECEDAFSTKAQLDAHLKLHNEKWSSEDVRKCKLCNKQFTQPALYRLHIREHYRLQTKIMKQTKRGTKHKTMYKCKICLKSFQKPSQLMRHIRVHTGEKPFKCTICSRAFTQKGSLQIHMWKHNGFRPHGCSFCNAKFSQKGNLNAHILRVHSVSEGEPTYGCNYCACIFKKLGSLNGHMKRMHSNPIEEKSKGENSTEADMQATVDTVMSQLASLESSVENSESVAIAKNDILQQALKNSGLPSKDKNCTTDTLPSKKGEAQTTFVTLLDRSTDGSMRRYVTIKQRSIGSMRWYACSFCHKEFKKPSDLIRHLRIHTQEKPFKCSYCFRSFALKSTMMAHERTHTGTKKYTCGSCDKTFACHSSLTAHARLHTKPHRCNACDKSFSSSTVLRNHLKSHAKGKIKISPEAEVLVPQIVLDEPLVISDSGNKISVAQVRSKERQVYNNADIARPHKCWVCPAAFRKISHLKQHYRRHTGERPYKCQKCDRRFTSNSVLKSHLHTHEDTRPYSCSMCGAKFSTQSSMKRHLVTHSNKRPFMCPYCHKTFKTSVNCRKHMKIHKHELAQQQLDQQKTQQRTQLPSVEEEREVSTLVNENSLALTNEMDVTFQPQMAPDFSQAFSDQFQTISVDKDKSYLSQQSTTQPVVIQNQAEVDAVTRGTSQTLHADETGTITLPNYSGDQTLTPESIREIEETLNQQLFNIGMNLGMENGLTRHDNVSNSLETREQPVLNIIYDSGKSLEPTSESGTINANAFPSQFDTFDMSQITLQADTEMDIGISSANSTSMASILPRSAQEEHRLVSVTANNVAEDNQAKQSRHLVVVSSVHTCPELSRPVQACPKYSKVIAKADTTDNSDTQGAEIRQREETRNSYLVTSDQRVPSLTCGVCDKHFQRHSQLKAHSKAHVSSEAGKPDTNEMVVPVAESDSRLQCHMCSKKGFTAATLKEHLKTHRGTKEFQCTECSLRFCTNGGLSRHLKMHASKLQCSVCDKTFPSKAQLNSHSQVHDVDWSTDSVEPDSSQKEPLTVDSNYLLITEVNAEGGTDSAVSQKVLMDTVAETETTDQRLNGQIERKEYVNKCKYCPKTFRKPSDLIRHVRTHTGERPYQCEYCSKSFAVKCTLDCHMQVHTGKKTFSCHVCNTFFATKGSLKVHMRLHTGSKPFRCSMCDLRFRTSGHRKVHLQTHTRDQKAGSKRKSKQLKVSAIAGVAAELERTVESTADTETTTTNRVSRAAELPSLDSITIDTSGLSDQITFNADGTILNNNSILSINESTQLVANLHFLIANGLVTIQADETLMPQLSSTADANEPRNETIAGELMTPETLERVSCANENPESLVMTSEAPVDSVTDQTQSLGLTDCATVVQINDIDTPFDKIELVNAKPTAKVSQSKKECDICGKTFMKPCQVERHKRIHTGERPYKCGLCFKSFAQKSTLKMHQKHHTGDRPHPCPHCDYSFTQKGNLRTHLKRVHQLDTLEVKKLRRGQQVLSAKLLQDNIDDTRTLSLDDISFVDLLR